MISETLKNLSREKLEELCQLALEREHIATRRANDLEDKIDKACKYVESYMDEIIGVAEFNIMAKPKTLLAILKGEIIEEEKEIEEINILTDDSNMEYVANKEYGKLSYSQVDLLFANKINKLVREVNKLKKEGK